MKHTKGFWQLASFGLITLALAVTSACAGISQEQYDAAKKEAADQQTKATVLQQQLSSRVQEVSAKDKEITDIKQKLTDKEKEATDLQQKLGSLAGVTPLIFAKAAPTPTPRPTPTPLPPGVSPPPAATPEAAWVNEVLPFAFYVETLATSSVSKYGMASYPACVPNSQFKRGTKLVWRFEVIDTSTGKRVTDQDGSKTEILLPNGEKVTPRYSKRGGIGPWMWGAGWDIPPDYPLGTLDYKIIVTSKDGRAGTFDQNKLALVRAGTATAERTDSRLQIIE